MIVDENTQPFKIFTECINCGKIAKHAIKSYFKYHNHPITIYGTKDDFKHIEPNDKITFFEVKSQNILSGFKDENHYGTAALWAGVIYHENYKYLIHFDSDVIFRGNVIDDILKKLLEEGFDLVGPIRNYKNNPYNDPKFKLYPDVVSTYCFGFNRTKISNIRFNGLVGMCRGTFNPYKHPTIDFFDPVSFMIVYNEGRRFFLDFDDVGASNNKCSRDNCLKEYNNIDAKQKIDFGKKIAHFSAVGSGMNVWNNPEINIPDTYKEYAKLMYGLYCKIFYNEDLGMDLSKYQKLIDLKDWY